MSMLGLSRHFRTWTFFSPQISYLPQKLPNRCDQRNVKLAWEFTKNGLHVKTRPIVQFSNFCVQFQREYTNTNQINRKQDKSSYFEANLVIMKIDTPEFRALFTPELRKLFSVFKKYNHELRIAGGPVRDLLMQKTSDDIDLATTATPQQMKQMFEEENIRMINMNGEKHGTITCRIDDKENYEITTLRIDVETDGRHAEVEFTTDWQLDSLRRDLTINSMFLSFDGTIHDYYNGIGDLEARKIRFVGDARSRIQEDYLRILRYFRFYGRISETAEGHEQSTLTAIQENIHGLAGISGERLLVELKKILIGRYTDSLINAMMDVGMAKYLGLREKPNTEQFHMVYERCHDLKPKPLTLVPALMDEENEMYTFHERVKLSREELRTGLFILQHRDDDLGDDPLRYCKHLHCDTVGKEPKTHDRIIELLKYLNRRDILEEYRAWEMPKFPIRGHILLQRGVQKGPQLAKFISALRNIWKESGFELSEDELLDHLDDLKEKIK